MQPASRDGSEGSWTDKRSADSGRSSRPVSSPAVPATSLPATPTPKPCTTPARPPPSPASGRCRRSPNSQRSDPSGLAGSCSTPTASAPGAGPGWIWPPPQLLYTRFAKQGWDVIKVQRNERCEGGWTRTGGRYVGDFAKRVAELKSAGYRRIIAAGQSVGAAVALGASGRTGDIDGVFAFALSHGRGSCRRADQFRHEMIGFHERHIRNAIRAAKAPRIVIVLAKDDHCIGHSFTPLVNAELSKKKGIAWVYLDETSAVPGHGAAQRSGFDRIYGECLSGFMNDDAIVPGRSSCDSSDG